MAIKRRCIDETTKCICRDQETGLCEARWATVFGHCEQFPYTREEFYQIMKDEEELEKSFATKIYVREDGIVCG